MGNTSVLVKLTNVRCSFLEVIEPKAYQGQAPRYSAHFLIPKTDTVQVKAVQAALVEVANAKWKDAAPGMLKAMQQKGVLCLHDGDQKVNASGEPTDGYPGHWYVSSSAKESSPPKVFRGKDLITPENVSKFRDGVPYSGCFVHALVGVWAQDNQYGKRVNASLDAVLFAGDGPRFGGGGVSTGKALDEFADLIDDEAALDTGAKPAGMSGADMADLFGS